VRHVTGPELLDGVRQYALKEFGPMVMTVFDSWGIRSCEDIGHMVFNLIAAGGFGKTEQDSIEDFKNVYDFEEAFVRPFAPAKPEGAEKPARLSAPNPATSSKLILPGELNENFTLAVGHQLSDYCRLTTQRHLLIECSSNVSHPSSEFSHSGSIISHGQFEGCAT